LNLLNQFIGQFVQRRGARKADKQVTYPPG
jgi:hypothetical protein